MEIRDVIHGSIDIENHELPIVDSRFFQRLRQIKQLGFAEFSFPSATHNRYIHSLGAMHTASMAFENIFSKHLEREAPQSFYRYRAIVRLAALLHDIGHGPLSHTTEFAMPPVSELSIAPLAHLKLNRKATHEDYTLKIILDSSLTPLLEKAVKPFGFSPLHIAALIEPSVPVSDDFFKDRLDGELVDFQPILHQLISSELDADRMDYLRRDSRNAGVSYGEFDFDWIMANLTFHTEKGRCYLALQHRALYTFEDFLISRFHMFLMVYFHHKSVIFDEMLSKYFASPDCDYKLPADIENYCDYNDGHLYAHLAESNNPWAIRISEKRPYRVLVEAHSGIPATASAHKAQQDLIVKIKSELNADQIHFLETYSASELSKYFRKLADPIFIRYDNHYSSPSFIPLEKCTDLFERYSEKRSVTRVYISPEEHKKFRAQGKGLADAIQFEF